MIHKNWIAINNAHIDEYVEAYKTYNDFTKYIGKVVYRLGDTLGLKVYPEYYALDYVFYKEEDLVPDHASTWSKSSTTTWLKRFRIAFEHENQLVWSAGGYQEFSHLMLTNADAKVLVGIGASFESYYVYAQDYQTLMKGLEDEPAPILFIGEYYPKINQNGDQYLEFESYIISSSGILKL